MSRITINNVVFDPDQPPMAAAAIAVEPRTVEETNYILVQTVRALNGQDKAQLKETGAEITEYVEHNTYVCYYPPQTLVPIRSLPFVKWVGPYFRGFKINPALAMNVPAVREQHLGAMNLEAVAAHAPAAQKVEIIFHRNVDPALELERVAEVSGTSLDETSLGPHKIRAIVPTATISQIAKLDTVRHIEKALPDELCNDRAREILRVPAGNPAPVLTGAGQVVAVADTGFDNGKIDGSVHPAFAGRVSRLYALGRKGANGSNGNADDPQGHGTHVAGSVLGDGSSETLGVVIQGTAPEAHLVSQSCYSSAGDLAGLPDDLTSLFSAPYQNDGARIHSNSWGNPKSAGTYNQRAFEVDDFVFKHRDCIILFASGNDGVDAIPPHGEIDLGSVTAPGTAKNCLTVGATENCRPDPFMPDPPPVTLRWDDSRFPSPPINGDLRADNPEGMAAFSGRGPTQQRRIKPDVVAPGTFILSTRSRHLNSDPRAPSRDPDYFFDSGTSMATPLVSGCAAVVRQWLGRDHNLVNPSSALLKALLINGARDIAGQYTPSEAPEIPNYSEGFGIVDVAASVNHLGNHAHSLLFWDEATALDGAGEETRTVELPPEVQQLKATLVWTDPPGAGLQNDLDLIVRDAHGDECHGNKKVGDPAFDADNNVEQIHWTKPAAGQASVTVRATRITLVPQSYALVIRIA